VTAEAFSRIQQSAIVSMYDPLVFAGIEVIQRECVERMRYAVRLARTHPHADPAAALKRFRVLYNHEQISVCLGHHHCPDRDV
jgi:hypothetical protein